jgi:uncharacterized protein (TIGR03437 family)
MKLSTGVFFSFLLALSSAQRSNSNTRQQQVTLAPAGPFHISGNRILDSRGRTFLMRGTQLTDFRLETAKADAHSEDRHFGPHSTTSFSAIRLRFNMNAVRVPLETRGFERPGYFERLSELVQRANDLELLAVLAARPSANADAFWKRTAAVFKGNPNVMFDVGSAGLASVVRATGAAQPVIVSAGQTTNVADVIYEVAPRWATTRTDADRQAQFGALAARAPVLSVGWDLELADAKACASYPKDPAAIARMVEDSLNYYDTHQISWTASTYSPGKLISDYSQEDATTLDNGWNCGPNPQPAVGMGLILESHLRATVEHGLFPVNTGGGPDLPRGGLIVAYGPVMAARDEASYAQRTPPTTLGGIKVEITDAKGVSRLAGLIWASEGWGQVNFVVPDDSAVGPARLTILRDNGSRLSTSITIADTAPGFWTNMSCPGPVKGTAVHEFGDGRRVESQVSSCVNQVCASLPIDVPAKAKTTVRLSVSGFRHARSVEEVEIMIGGTRVPVVSFGPTGEAGMDQVTIEIPASLRGKGGMEMIARVRGRVTNAVRIRFGSAS